MGKINRGILGGFTGKVGNVVGSSWKGIETMRALPISVLNPRTTAQVGNRTRFGNISTLAAAMLTTIVKPLNDRFASRMSGYNMFTSRNSAAFDDSGSFEAGNLVLSTGKLGSTPITANSTSGSYVMEIDWDDTPVGSYQMPTDKLYAAVVKDDGTLIGTSSGVVDRSSASVTFDCDSLLLHGRTYYVYASFMRADGTIVGNSSMALAVVEQ